MSRERRHLHAHTRALAPQLVVAVVTTVAAVTVACAPALTRGVPDQAPSAAPAPAGNAAPPVVAGVSEGRLERARDRMAHVALDGRARLAPVSATGRWRIDEQGGRGALVRGQGDEPWRIEQNGRLLRVAGEGSDATPWREGPFVARPLEGETFVRYSGKRYRGELWFTATDSGVMVVNRLPVEDYLRGVVPLEIGTRSATDRAAIEAQAIAARSYTYVRVPEGSVELPVSGWNLTATVQHQVYGGVEAEHPVVNAAIDATAGLVLRYNGKAVDAPFHSSCGGRTAAPTEAWRGVNAESYLQPVSDIDPRTGRPFCDLSPRNHWHAEFDEAQLAAAVRGALQAQGARDPRPAAVHGIKVGATGPSGRVTSLVLATERGDVPVAARDIRAVLRDARGAMLQSTYFTVDREARRGARLASLTLRGAGNGHGVGMCQWGAIGRARAGADARSILRHYYPGTAVGFAD